MKIQTLNFSLSVIILSLNLVSGQSFNDTLRDVSVIDGNGCNVDSSGCGNCTTRTCGRSCQGRIGFPTMHVLSSTSNHFSYCVQSKSLSPFPNAADSSPNRQFTFKTSRTCSQKIEVEKATTISFWIKGSCSPVCDFMTVSSTGTEEYKWSLDDTDLKVNNSIAVSNTADWTHIGFRVTKNTFGLFVNGIPKTVSLSSSTIQVDYTVEFGPAKGFESGDSVSFLDVRVYEDFLTDNEIKSVQSGSFLESCRCSTTHPRQTAGTDTCESESSSSQTKYIGDTTTFYDIKAVYDSNAATVWASKATAVTLKLQLYDHYKVTKVNVAHEGNVSSTTVEINSKRYTCTITTNNIACTISPSNARTTDEINLELKAPTTGQILISEITVTGECDCNGYENGACLRPNNYQTYTCNCNGTRGGQKCQECAAGYSDSSNCIRCNPNMGGSNCDECDMNYYANFTKCFLCNCEKKGTERCDKVTGECSCKTGVNGTTCNSCKKEYYGFNQTSDEVCKSCNCSQAGSNSSVCSKLGQCECKDDNVNNSRQCTPSGSFSPQYGPVAGGTTITITGNNFAMNPTVKLGGDIQNLSSSNVRNRIQFNASPGGLGDKRVMVSWNGEEIGFKEDFTYKPNPSIDTEQINKNIQILGGCKMMYKGSNFDSVFQPQLEFKTRNYSQKCNVISNEQIECIVPQLKGTMDTYLNLDCPNCGVHQTVNIKTPEVDNDTKEDFTYPFNKRITIKGENLNLCGEDIKVSIEGINCTNIIIKETEISCEPPKDSPQPLEVKKVYKIMVQIGTYYTVNAGEITYRDFVNSSYFVYIMIGICAFVLIAIALFIWCMCRRKKHKNRDMAMSISAPAVSSTIPNNYTEMQKTNIDIIRPPSTVTSGIQNSAYTSEQSFEETKKNFLQKLPHGLKPEVAACIINENEFSFGKICYAKGDKARVIDGKLTKGHTTTQIMIKSIKKPFLDNEDYPDWVFKVLTECVRFRNLSHTNILSIHGIGLEKRKFHILYPFMKNKTLKDFVSDEKKEFSLKQLLGYGVQISEGMCYLYDQNIVHEDIATRNCMVSDDSLIKISDSAYSHDFYPTEYMLDLTKNRYLPVRWMAPESIKFGFYDIKSDVWSYGVLLWELLTRGCLPFIDTADTGVYDLITQGYRLGKPEIISDEIYDLINKCWEEESEFRPSFAIIRDTLSNLMVGDSAGQDDLYINWTEPRQSIYMNSESFKRKSEKNQSEPYYGNL